MKKSLTALLIFIASVFLISCGSNGYYDQGYEDGYEEGLLDGRLEAESELYDKRFESGYDEGFFRGDNYGREEVLIKFYYAQEYAHSKTGLSIYEAYNTIGIYHDGVDPDGFPLPTKKEYEECVKTLVCFFEYLERVDF